MTSETEHRFELGLQVLDYTHVWNTNSDILVFVVRTYVKRKPRSACMVTQSYHEGFHYTVTELLT